ncbi:serine/threonine protein kinase [Mesorhizobium sp. B2-4-19]|uniref:serine/threonine-protein kinase n=1 Tax=Mesorhizobium sp. B2-4-19 TaxID=2589930 RepID=UPI00112DC42A|nr:serine/threonine-protein kinase [Mesorhizobium sp. B2-4-19]TPK61663.1 serine/threonine protein kinase [Mesorhizobium sp. B2-4-19]
MINLPSRYAVVIQTLSGGGMSDTLVCRDENLQRKVVVKSLKAGIEKHRLMDELSALADIRSKYVVQVLDVLRDGSDIVGFVEEFIEGSPLKPLDPATSETKALGLLYSIISGINDIHLANRVHRDIKPDNMKIDSSGVLKIFDFGLAKMQSDAKTKQLYYTAFYTAPEVFKPDKDGNHNFNASVDVFAFGATALWLFNGGNLPPELGYTPPIVPAVPSNFDNIPLKLSVGATVLLNRCLSSNPSSRPSAADLKAALGKQLLYGKHRMLLTHNGTDHVVDSAKKQVKLSSGSDTVTISYNGLDFVVTAFSGHVRHNNKQVMMGYVLQGSSVIVLGDPSLRGRTSITADVSHPEVMN